jgi:hypothetical protein
MYDGIQSLRQRHLAASFSVTAMPHGTEVRPVGAIAVLLDNPMTFPRSLLWKRVAGDRFVETTDYSPCLPHEKSSSFFLTYALSFYCSRADE